MKVGITFGCYCPLHQGHLDEIMRAKKENDLCVVIVCGYDGDRGEPELPLQKRYRIIKNFLEDSTTKVVCLSDTELGIDQSYSDSNWKIWLDAACKKVLAECDYDVGFVHWYVGEPSYKDHILKQSPATFRCITVSLADRNENPVSGTLCREHPLQYWDKITAPFRAYYSHNILITGTASEGKTTLCQDLGRYFNLPYSYEKGRDICHIKTDPEMTVKDFMYNIYEQHKYNEELISSPLNPGVFISDTDNIVTLMYATDYADRKGFSLKSSELQVLGEMARTYAKTDKWDKIFILSPSERPMVDDGERYMEDGSYEKRYQMFRILCDLYDMYGYEYEILGGNYYENFCKVRDYIKSVKEM